MQTWHESDDFWETFAPMMFGEARWQAVPIEIDQIIARLGLEPEAAVLDLCCGPGRHSLEMARRGLRVTGVDRTAAYLAKARRQAEEEGLQIEFVEADMRHFTRENAFDGALIMYTSFGYFEDPAENLGVLANVCHSLKPGGALIIEMMGKEVLARIFQPRSWSEQDGMLFLEQRTLGKDWSWIKNRWILIREGERRAYEISHWLYSAAELRGMLVDCGFRQVDCFGSLEGAPYDQDARRLVAVARK
jgi:SAM-dependent methyltransferase